MLLHRRAYPLSQKRPFLDTARLLASIFLTTLPKLAYKATHLTLNNDATKLIFFHQEYGQRISYDITLAEREVRPDPRPLCCSCPPLDSMAPVGTRFKRVRAHWRHGEIGRAHV